MWLMGRSHRFQRTTLISVGLGGVLFGLAVAKLTGLTLDYLWAICFSLLLLIFWRRKNIFCLYLCFAFGFCLGSFRTAGFLTELGNYEPLYYQTVTLIVKAETDGVYSDKSQLEFDASNVRLFWPYEENLVGQVKVSGFGAPHVSRGDFVAVSGKLYPTRGSKRAVIRYAQMEVVTEANSSLDNFRVNFLVGLRNALPEPQASLGAGLLIGQRSELPDEVNQNLRVVGLTHIIAVSGYNLTILVEFVRKSIGKKSKRRSTIVSLGLVVCFILLAGSSPSIARASFVSILTIISAHYGRKVRPSLLILLAAAVTAFYNPLNIWFDIGWHLSFLAFYGVLILAPLILQRLSLKSTQFRRPIFCLLIETLSAQLMTLPLIMFIFAEVSTVGLIANLLVLPLVPFAMALSALSGLAGMTFATIAGWLSWPANLLMIYMLDVAKIMSGLPKAFVSIRLGIAGLSFLYLIVLLVSISLYHRLKNVKIDIENERA
jgi:competence protein ComEC